MNEQYFKNKAQEFKARTPDFVEGETFGPISMDMLAEMLREVASEVLLECLAITE